MDPPGWPQGGVCGRLVGACRPQPASCAGISGSHWALDPPRSNPTKPPIWLDSDVDNSTPNAVYGVRGGGGGRFGRSVGTVGRTGRSDGRTVGGRPGRASEIKQPPGGS